MPEIPSGTEKVRVAPYRHCGTVSQAQPASHLVGQVVEAARYPSASFASNTWVMMDSTYQASLSALHPVVFVFVFSSTDLICSSHIVVGWLMVWLAFPRPLDFGVVSVRLLDAWEVWGPKELVSTKLGVMYGGLGWQV